MSSSSHLKEKVPQDKKFDFLRIPYEDIKEATKNFTTVIKKDDYVIVYKGELSISGKSTNVTIKRLRLNSDDYGSDVLSTKIGFLSGFKHSNIVSLLGFCDQDDTDILIYEYGEHGSLDDYLSTTNQLSLMQRIDICINAARGLDYLHGQRVSHGRISSSNVMLGQNCKAMIANLGLSKISPIYKTDVMYRIGRVGSLRSHSEPYSGQKRYVYSESTKKIVTELSEDVGAFGLVLFEVLCGRNLAPLAKQYYQEGRLNEIIDVNLKTDQVDSYSLNRFSDIAYQCLESDWAQRPSMGLVVRKLEEIIKWQGIFLQVQTVKHLKIPLKNILLATNNFDISCRIGLGGYGHVYKAILKIKSKDEPFETLNTVAIKRIISSYDDQEEQGFILELDVLSRCKHPNIVSLLGFCVEDGEMILVNEYVSNGSLEDCFGSIDTMSYLKWAQRLKMCIDIAQGLKYMHSTMEDKKRIIHRDIKSANILLGNNWEAKIADFGLSKLQPIKHQESTINTKTLAGTEFYLDPEYARTGRLKKASDIYSLGVVLYEIFSGKLAYDSSYIMKNEKGLAPIARRHFKNGIIKELLDPKMMDPAYELGFTGKLEPDHDSVDVFSNIAYQCLAKAQVKRPTIQFVIEELEKALLFQENQIKSLKFSLEHIRLGVWNFSDDNCIMKGRYATLYKGKVQYNNRDIKVAVKRFSHDRCFLKEVEVLFKYKHENIIGLVGYCKEMDEKMIVYEHASNGSLDRYLNDTSFSWIKRLKICIDIANGLKFLHGGDLGQDVVIHRDIKSSNILVNKDWKAKICGFELALTYPTNQEIEYVTDNVEGSLGYRDPLFQETHFLTKESDIYSFGMILFETLCGRLACPEDLRDRSQFLDVVVKHHFKETPVAEMVFEGIREQIEHDSLATFLEIAFQCLRDKKEERPTAGDVVVQLQIALEFQAGHKKILSMSPEIYSEMAKKEIYDILSKGTLLEHDRLEIARTIQLHGQHRTMDNSFMARTIQLHGQHRTMDNSFMARTIQLHGQHRITDNLFMARTIQLHRQHGTTDNSFMERIKTRIQSVLGT